MSKRGRPEKQGRGRKRQEGQPDVELAGRLPEVRLVPTERDKQLLQELFDWQERSAKSNWVLGQPLGRPLST